MAFIRFSLMVLAGLAGVAAPVPAAAQPTPAEQSAMRQAMTRGQLLFAYDRAAWHGTDDMLRKLEAPEQRLGGWIVDGPAETPTLIFFDKDEANPKAVYVASFKNGKLVSSRLLSDSEDRSLSPERRRMIAARSTASRRLVEAKVNRCSERTFNTVVLPPEGAGGPLLVYFLTPQTDSYAIPFGGHYLIEVSADGKAGQPRRFTNACLSMPLPRKAEKKPVTLVVSHLLDPTPTEIHVFSSLASGYPVAVGTSNGKLWMVGGSSIGLVGNRKK